MAKNFFQKELYLFYIFVGIDEPVLDGKLIYVYLKKLEMIAVHFIVLMKECINSWYIVLG